MSLGPNESKDVNERDGGGFAANWRKPRACARCHRLKMRCYYTDPSYKNCNRCFSIGVECSLDRDPTARYARKNKSSCKSEKNNQQDLLTKLQSLTANVNDIMVQLTTKLNDDDSTLKSKVTQNTLYEAKFRLQEAIDRTCGLLNEPCINEFPPVGFAQNIVKELIFNYKMLDLEECRQRFEFFLSDMLPFYPIISFSQNLYQFDYLLEEKPILLLACIAVTTVHKNKFSLSNDNKKKKLDNESLREFLYYYLDRCLSHRLYIQSDQFSLNLVQICIILSTWSPPPKKYGHFKNMMNVLAALSVSLCMGLGQNLPLIDQDEFNDISEEINESRTFLSVFCTCASLGLSLVRFKVVLWSKNHTSVINKLSKSPYRTDKFLVVYAKALKLAQEIQNALDLDDFNIKIDGDNTSLPATLTSEKLLFIAQNYDKQLLQLLEASEFIKPDVMESFVLHIMYHQVLLAMYDKTLSAYLAEDHSARQHSTYVFLITHIVTSCEKLLDSYIKLTNKTVNYPTFVYYRPMHALVLLIRLRLLIKAQPNQLHGSINIKVEEYFDKVQKNLVYTNTCDQSDMSRAMKEILAKIQKWIRVSEEYTNSPIDQPFKATRSNILINIMNRRKHQEIEALEVPEEMPKKKTKLDFNENPTSNTMVDHISSNNTTDRPNLAAPTSIPAPTTSLPFQMVDQPVEKLFHEIDLDISQYLNFLESNGTSMNGVSDPSDSFFTNFISDV